MPICNGITRAGNPCKRHACEGILTCASHASECSICLDKIKMNELTVTPCGHLFHVTCLDPWTHEHDTCPLCRQLVQTRRKYPTVKWDDIIDECIYSDYDLNVEVVNYVKGVEAWDDDINLWLIQFGSGVVLADVNHKHILRFFAYTSQHEVS